MLLNGKLTGLWEPELLLVGRGCYSGFFCDILSLNVKMYL